MVPDILAEVNDLFPGASVTGLGFVREKDGIAVWRLRVDGRAAVVKRYTAEEPKRELHNYELLAGLGVPTAAVLAKNDRLLCMEDIAASPRWRLATADDLSDPAVAAAVAGWYRCLHRQGSRAPGLKKLYRESDALTPEAVGMLRGKAPSPLWELLLRRMDELRALIDSLPETLTYNDFYWTNLAVARDKRAAFLFDYNLLGRGYRYGDIRNVLSSLQPPAEQAFLETYGPWDPREAAVDDAVSPIVTLIFAWSRDPFPAWGRESLALLESGELERRVRALLETKEESP